MIQWAEEQATILLPSLGNRWLHVQGVVRAARYVGQIFEVEDYNYLVAAAYLHDIGYAPQIKQCGFHPLDGARFVLDALGDIRLASLIAHHSEARFEAQLRGLNDELHVFAREQSAVADALTYCDQITGPTGLRVSPKERANEAMRRYGEKHITTQAVRISQPHIFYAISKTRQRLIKHRTLK